MTSIPVAAKLQNTKEREFRVKGRYWSDGAVLVDNPRPQKYDYPKLYTDPEIYYEDDPKRLYWVECEEPFKLGPLSPFAVKTLLADAKLVKKPASKTKT